MPQAGGEQWNWPLIRSRCRAEALRIVRRHHDAEEVVQEAMTRAWRSRHACRTPEAPLPWCLQITRNEAIRLIGNRRRVPASEPFGPSTDLKDDKAQARIDRLIERIALERILAALTAPEQALMRLRYEQDCSHPEIAAALGIPESTARVRLHRLHNRIRLLLDAEGYLN